MQFPIECEVMSAPPLNLSLRLTMLRLDMSSPDFESHGVCMFFLCQQINLHTL